MLAAVVVEQLRDQIFSEALRLGHVRAYGRAVAALMRHGNLDAAHLLELVRQHAVVQQLVPIFDPRCPSLGIAQHDADDPWIWCAGPLGRFDHLAVPGGLFGFIDIAQPRHHVSPCVISAPTWPLDYKAKANAALRKLNVLYP